jgi:hypothetical protein
MGLSYTIAAGPCQSSHSQVRVMTTFYCLRFETPPTWRARSPYLYPTGTTWPGYTPRHWVPFSSPSTTRRATVEVFDRASTGKTLHLRSNMTRLMLLKEKRYLLGKPYEHSNISRMQYVKACDICRINLVEKVNIEVKQIKLVSYFIIMVFRALMGLFIYLLVIGQSFLYSIIW